MQSLRAHFAIDENMEPCTPEAIAHVEKSAQLPQVANILKNLKPLGFGGEEKK